MCSQCPRFPPNLFTFGGVIAERVNTVSLPSRVFHYRLFKSIIKEHQNIRLMFFIEITIVVVSNFFCGYVNTCIFCVRLSPVSHTKKAAVKWRCMHALMYRWQLEKLSVPCNFEKVQQNVEIQIRLG